MLLLIPDCVLSKFKDEESIQRFISLRDREYRSIYKEPLSPLAKVCQMLRKKSDTILNGEFTKEDKEMLGNLVDALDLPDKKQLYYRIWELAWNKNDGQDPISWGEQHRFNDMLVFVPVLGEFLYQQRKKYLGCW